jgi:hypothetical protein
MSCRFSSKMDPIIISVIIILVLILLFHKKCNSIWNGERLSKAPTVEVSNINYIKKNPSTFAKLKNKMKSPDELMDQAIGNQYDDVVKSALQQSLDKRKKTSNDMFRIARIYDYYLHDPTKAEKYYAKTLHKLNKHPRRGNMQMLNQIEDFEKQLDQYRMNEIFDNEDQQTLHWRDGFARPNVGRGMIINFTPTPTPEPAPAIEAAQIEATRWNIINDAVIKSKTKSKDRAKQQDHYFKNAAKVNSDIQNVHDTKLNKDLQTTYYKIKSYNDNDPNVSEYTLNGLTNYVGSSGNPNAAKALNTMLSTNQTITSIGASEKNILLNTWRRINSTDNVAQKENLQEALVEGLASCTEGNVMGSGLVCDTGRVSRVIGSFATLDKDPEVGNLKTKPMLRNAAIMKAGQIIQNSIKQHTDRDLINAYNTGNYTSNATEKNVQQYEQQLKSEIDSVLTTDYANEIDAPELANIIAESQAGV